MQSPGTEYQWKRKKGELSPPPKQNKNCPSSWSLPSGFWSTKVSSARSLRAAWDPLQLPLIGSEGLAGCTFFSRPAQRRSAAWNLIVDFSLLECLASNNPGSWTLSSELIWLGICIDMGYNGWAPGEWTSSPHSCRGSNLSKHSLYLRSCLFLPTLSSPALSSTLNRRVPN